MTAKDIITRSILMHPSLFQDALKARADADAAYAVNATGRTLQSVEASRKQAMRAHDFAGRDDLPEGERAACIVAECGPMIIALNVACKLQCLPPHVRHAAAVQWEESNA